MEHRNQYDTNQDKSPHDAPGDLLLSSHLRHEPSHLSSVRANAISDRDYCVSRGGVRLVALNSPKEALEKFVNCDHLDGGGCNAIIQ